MEALECRIPNAVEILRQSNKHVHTDTIATGNLRSKQCIFGTLTCVQSNKSKSWCVNTFLFDQPVTGAVTSLVDLNRSKMFNFRCRCNQTKHGGGGKIQSEFNYNGNKRIHVQSTSWSLLNIFFCIKLKVLLALSSFHRLAAIGRAYSSAIEFLWWSSNVRAFNFPLI